MSSKNQRKDHKPVKVSNWVKACLPDSFQEKSASIQQYQAFFEQQTSDAVYALVKVLNVNDNELTLAVPSPALVNYLRLHEAQIRRQIETLFHHSMSIKVVAQPELMETDTNSLEPVQSKHYSATVCAQIQKSAASLEDNDLRDALLSLAKTLQQD